MNLLLQARRRGGERRLLAAALALGAGLSLAAIVPVQAASGPAASPAPGHASGALHLRLSAEATGARLQLTAVATRSGGGPAAGIAVSFFVVSTEFHTPLSVPLGTATTSALGVASLPYTATWRGAQHLVATAAGARATTTAVASAFVPGYATDGARFVPNPPLVLGAVGQWLVLALLAIVATIWVILIGTFVRTLRAIRRSPAT